MDSTSLDFIYRSQCFLHANYNQFDYICWNYSYCHEFSAITTQATIDYLVADINQKVFPFEIPLFIGSNYSHYCPPLHDH